MTSDGALCIIRAGNRAGGARDMIDAKMISDMDQGIACMREVVGAGTFAAYTGFIEAGFTEEQAFELAKEWLRCISGHHKG